MIQTVLGWISLAFAGALVAVGSTSAGEASITFAIIYCGAALWAPCTVSMED